MKILRRRLPAWPCYDGGRNERYAFLALPGGIGTLEELFETWTAGYLGMHEKPIVLLDPHGHFAVLLDWLASLVQSGYVAQYALDRLQVVHTLDDALRACAPVSAPR